VLTGIADCFRPNERPCRCGGTCRDSAALLASCPAALAPAPTASQPISPANDRADRPSPAMLAADSTMAPRAMRAAPNRSTSAPAGTDASALTPKYTATARPSPAGLKCSSRRICTASPPTRNTGITTATVVVTAPAAARTAPPTVRVPSLIDASLGCRGRTALPDRTLGGRDGTPRPFRTASIFHMV
jgi:hypothetical protein